MEHTQLSSMGGKARAAKLSKRARSIAARKAVNARWAKARAAAKPKGKAR